MTTLNNFDQSSTGLNIELSAYYDCDLARIYFDECFERDGDDLIYADHGNLPKNWQKSVYFYGTTKNIIKQFACYHGDVKEFIEWLKYMTNDDYLKDVSLKDLEGIVEDLADYLGFSDEFELCENVLSDDLFSFNYTTQEVIGYSQGDRVTVIVPEDLREILGVPNDREIASNDYLTNLIYNAPVRGRIIINGDDELYLDEMIKDYYQWDKDQVMVDLPRHLSAYTDEQKKIIIDFCDENLPENLDYVY